MPELYASFFNEQNSDINASKYLSQIMKASIKNLGSKQPSPIDTENGVKKNKFHFDATVQNLTRAVRMLEVASVEVGDYPNAGLQHPIIKAIDYITSAAYSLGEIDIDFLDANMLLKMKKLFDDFFNVIEGIREKELSDFGANKDSGSPITLVTILLHLDEAADNLLQKAKFFMDYGRRVLERSPGSAPEQNEDEDSDEDKDEESTSTQPPPGDGGGRWDDESDDDDSDDDGSDDDDSDGNSDDEQAFAKFVQINPHIPPSSQVKPPMWDSPRPSAPGAAYTSPAKKLRIVEPSQSPALKRLTDVQKRVQAKASPKPQSAMLRHQTFARNYAQPLGLKSRDVMQTAAFKEDWAKYKDGYKK